METQQVDDNHPNNVTDRFEVIGHVPVLMATGLSKFLKRPTYCSTNFSFHNTSFSYLEYATQIYEKEIKPMSCLPRS